MTSRQLHPHPSLSLDYEGEGEEFSLARPAGKGDGNLLSVALTSILPPKEVEEAMTDGWLAKFCRQTFLS
jgi:hypothetical protein